ncbi:MAG TPA: 2OG-Fe(II) oxygenase, partial [Geminicoccaceae bacterium]|nr:2OG-Fe(II) oxygenase [Geminicoccaceae bacterium]
MGVLPLFRPGDPVPLFRGRASNGTSDFDFSSVAGRYIVLAFLESASQEPVRRALAAVRDHRKLFDDQHASFFGVSVDPADETGGRLREALPGIRFFWDHDREISRRFGALGDEKAPAYRSFWLVLDPSLRVLASAPLAEAGRLLGLVAALPPVEAHAGCPLHAPVLILPRVFEPEFCRRLIELHQRHGGKDSGFMRDVDGKTVTVLDHGFKRRADHHIEDEAVCAAIRARIQRRIVPAVDQAFQFRVTRMERYLVACYDAGQGGHFRAHRDNTTKGTAHRRFAVTINLNAEDFEGGDLRFPEFGPRPYRAPTGGAVVFSCSLLHEAQPVTAGRRYAFLPFLYDEAAARIRVANNRYLGEGVGA